MLVLTRRSNQSIMIGTDIVVTVLEVRGEQVRIGIKAPREVEVHREEVFEALARERCPTRRLTPRIARFRRHSDRSLTFGTANSRSRSVHGVVASP